MKKKIVSLTLAASMLLGSLTACGGSKAAATNPEILGEHDDWPVITVQGLCSKDYVDEALVETEINKYLDSIDAGAYIDLVPIAMGNLNNQLTLMLTDNDEPLDLFCWRFYSTIDGCVKNDQCIPLDEYKDQYPEVWGLFNDQILSTHQIDGKQYGLPAMDSFATYETYMLRKDVAEDIGVADKDGQEMTLDEVTEIMKKAKAAHPEYAYNINTNDDPVQGIDSLGNGDWLGVLMNQGIDQDKIVNYYETDEWRDYCHRMKDWNDSGLLIPDSLNADLTIGQYGNEVAGGCYVGGYSEDYIKALVAYLPESVQFKLTDLVGTSASVLGGWCISTVCKNPDAAMKILSLMYTDETLARLLILGVEGRDYVVREDGTAGYPEGVSADDYLYEDQVQWFWPNQCLSIPFETNMTTFYTDMLEAPKNAKFSKAMGFVFDSTNVYDQMAACTAVVDEYRMALLYGQVDVDSYIDKFNQELKAAGIDEIIAEEQRQYDEFLSKKAN